MLQPLELRRFADTEDTAIQTYFNISASAAQPRLRGITGKTRTVPRLCLGLLENSQRLKPSARQSERLLGRGWGVSPLQDLYRHTTA
jgi:hypothetical protein